MPVKTCEDDGRPGYKWGSKGKCYTYATGDDAGRKKAKEKAKKAKKTVTKAFSTKKKKKKKH